METFGCKSFAKPTNCLFLEFRAKIFRLVVRKKSARLSSCFLLFHGNFLRKIFLKSFCSFCGPFFRSFPVIEQEKFGRPVKTAFFVSIKSFWKKLFQKTIENFHRFQTLSRRFSASLRVFRRGCWSCILRVQNNILTKNSFISNFFFFFGHWAIFWPILAKKVAELSKLYSQFQWKLSGEFFLQNLQIGIFLNIEWKNFGWLSEKSQRSFEAAFYLSRGTFWRKKLLKSFCIFCGPFFRSFPVIEHEKSGRPVKTAFFVSIKSFWKKTVLENNWIFSSFSDTEQKIFGLFSSFSTGSWSCILRVQGNTLWRTVLFLSFFLSWTLYNFFEHFSKKK